MERLSTQLRARRQHLLPLLLAAAVALSCWAPCEAQTSTPRDCTASEFDLRALVTSSNFLSLVDSSVSEIGAGNVPDIAKYSIDCDKDGVLDLLLLVPNQNGHPYFIVLLSSKGCGKAQGPNGWSWAVPENCPAFFGAAGSAALPATRSATSSGKASPSTSDTAATDPVDGQSGVTSKDVAGGSGGGAQQGDATAAGGAGSATSEAGSGSSGTQHGKAAVLGGALGAALGGALVALLVVAVVLLRRARAHASPRVAPLSTYTTEQQSFGRRIGWPAARAAAGRETVV